MNDETWEKLESKYGMTGYTDSLGIIEYDVVLKLVESEEKLGEIQGLLGSINTEPEDDIRRLIKSRTTLNWAVGELSILIDASKDSFLIKKKKKVLEKLRDSGGP